MSKYGDYKLKDLFVELDETSLNNETYTLTEAAEILEIDRSTLELWIESNQILGLHYAKYGIRIPKEVIFEKTPLDGLQQVLDLFGNHDMAWSFLKSTEAFTDGSFARPICELKDGKIAKVMDRAQSIIEGAMGF